jgi:hypothetical protein
LVLHPNHWQYLTPPQKWFGCEKIVLFVIVISFHILRRGFITINSLWSGIVIFHILLLFVECLQVLLSMQQFGGWIEMFSNRRKHTCKQITALGAIPLQIDIAVRGLRGFLSGDRRKITLVHLRGGTKISCFGEIRVASRLQCRWLGLVDVLSVGFLSLVACQRSNVRITCLLTVLQCRRVSLVWIILVLLEQQHGRVSFPGTFFVPFLLTLRLESVLADPTWVYSASFEMPWCITIEGEMMYCVYLWNDGDAADQNWWWLSVTIGTLSK